MLDEAKLKQNKIGIWDRLCHIILIILIIYNLILILIIYNLKINKNKTIESYFQKYFFTNGYYVDYDCSNNVSISKKYLSTKTFDNFILKCILNISI